MAALTRLTTDYFERSNTLERAVSYRWNKSLQEADEARAYWLHTEQERADDMTRDAAVQLATRRATEFGLAYVVVVNRDTGNHAAVTMEGWRTRLRAEYPKLDAVTAIDSTGKPYDPAVSDGAA